MVEVILFQFEPNPAHSFKKLANQLHESKFKLIIFPSSFAPSGSSNESIEKLLERETSLRTFERTFNLSHCSKD